MFRAYLYLLVSGIIWLVEGYLFSRYLFYAAWQTVLLGLLYLILFAVAVTVLLRAIHADDPSPNGIPAWRLLAYAPVVVAIIGSFVSLPLILLVVALGKI